jgi:rhamnosyltransferase
MSDPLISIIMRSYNEAWALRETLPALRAQDWKNSELIVIDSGSTDGSVELIRAEQPRHFVQIQPHEYNPSRVMNQGMRLARSEFCVFLNADATPQGANWLRPLAAALQDARTAAVFGRQIPRPDCRAVFAYDYDRCFGPQRESASWEHFFSMVSSGIRKDIWAQRGFREDLQYAEDDEYTRWCASQGYRIVYCEESVVMHSHNYTLQQAYKRARGDSFANAATKVDRAPGLRDFGPSLVFAMLRDASRDLAWCRRNGRLNEWPHALSVRAAQRLGKTVGFRRGWNHYHRTSTPVL